MSFPIITNTWPSVNRIDPANFRQTDVRECVPPSLWSSATSPHRLYGRRGHGVSYGAFRAFPPSAPLGLQMSARGFLHCRRQTYPGGHSPHLIKVKNRSHPAMERVKESFL